MADRALVGIMDRNTGCIRAIEVHSAGYPACTGAILLEDYNSEQDAQDLVDLVGDIHDLPPKGYCGEPVESALALVRNPYYEAQTYAGRREIVQCAWNDRQHYIYVWAQAQWQYYIGDHDEPYDSTLWVPLEKELAMLQE